jgi:hypothetical protein
MGKLQALVVVVCALCLTALAAGCGHLEPSAEAAPTESVGTGQILGMISEPDAVRDGVVRLGDSGPVARVASDGTFTFRGLEPGCYDLHLVEAGRETLAIESSAACVSAGRSALLSIIFGRL